MPELPEVECVRLGLESTLGLTIQSVEWNYPKLWDDQTLDPSSMKGQEIISTQRKGKYLLIHLKHSKLMMHLGMSGVFLLQSPEIPERPHTHMTLTLSNGQVLRYSDPRKFGHLHLADPEAVLTRWEKLGPDALERAFSGGYFFEKCQRSQRDIKVFLLDQKIVAGVGNIYASEALFRAKVDPRRPANSLTQDECAALAKASKWIMRKSIEQRGTTFSDYRLTNGKGGQFQGFLKVFQKQGETCPSCKKNLILKLEQDKRSTFYCDFCQK